jgi:hypothetical protein
MWQPYFTHKFIPTGRHMGTEGVLMQKVKCARPVHGISLSFSECTSTHLNYAVVLLNYKFITLTVHNFICRKHTLQVLGSRPPLCGASWITNQTF